MCSPSWIEIQVVLCICKKWGKKVVGKKENWVTKTYAQRKDKLAGSTTGVVKYVMHQEKEIAVMHVDWSHLPTKCIYGQSF